MSTTTDPNFPTISTSLPQKLSNLFVSPGEVFEEIVAVAPTPANFIVPTLLVCLAGVILLGIVAPIQQSSGVVESLAETGTASSSHAGKPAAESGVTAMLALCAGTIVGTCWSAFVLWFIGRFFLRSRFTFLKALEIAALSGMILVLATIVTGLLIAATGNVDARPALSLLALKRAPTNSLRSALELMNIFHVWTAFVLAVGLSKLSGVSFKEAAFWVIGYWILIRMVFLLLV